MRLEALTRADWRRASQVRSLLADVHGATPQEAVFLAPGTLAGLRLVFASLGVRRVVLSDDEYFDRRAFPAAQVDLVRPEALASHVVRHRPDAVILSSVTWRGRRIALEACFREIRTRLGTAAPVLVADVSHGGAAGFPRVSATRADVVLGDVGKWITPPDWSDRLGFLWFRAGRLRLEARRAFAPFYLAGTRPGRSLEARWVDPEAVARIVEWCRSRKVTRRKLLARHEADMALARLVAERCGARAPSTALVWLESAAAIRKVPAWAKDAGLLWRPAGGGARVTCRSDVAPPGAQVPSLVSAESGRAGEAEAAAVQASRSGR
jgi:hypothetical protein